MNINLITNINGVGLEQDARLIKSILEGAGHSCNLVQYNKDRAPKADLNIFFEILELADKHKQSAPKNVFIPNPEWMIGWHGMAANGSMDAIWVKSKSAIRPFKTINSNIENIRFTSRDMYLPEISKTRRFFHLAGKSEAKNTEIILQIWERYGQTLPALTVVIHPSRAPRFSRYKFLQKVNIVDQYVSDDTLKKLMNSHAFHLCPSQVEGWGHYIVEAMSTGAIVITTDAPPMNEHIQPERGFLVKTCGRAPKFKAVSWKVNYGDLLEQVMGAIRLTEIEMRSMGEKSRQWFVQEDAEFRKRVVKMVEEI